MPIVCRYLEMMNFVLRARKLDWEQIKFKEFSAEECKKYWEYIQVNKFIDDDVFMIRKETSWCYYSSQF